MALEWLKQEGTAQATICTDSQALLRALECRSSSVASIIKQLNTCTSVLVFQCIPAHSGVCGNTTADFEAKLAFYNWDEQYQLVSLQSAISALS